MPFLPGDNAEKAAARRATPHCPACGETENIPARLFGGQERNADKYCSDGCATPTETGPEWKYL